MTSNKNIWPQKSLSYMQELKSAILAIFRIWLMGQFGHALFIAALKKPSVELKTWMAELEVASFLPIRLVYRQCEGLQSEPVCFLTAFCKQKFLMFYIP